MELEEGIEKVLLALNKIEVEKDARIKELTDSLVAITKEKEKIQADLVKTQQTVAEQKEKIGQLKEQKKEAQDTVMGVSFDRDLKAKELEEKMQRLQEMEEKVAKVAGGTTGIVIEFDKTIEYFRQHIREANRSLRLVVPDVGFLNRYDLTQEIEKLPTNVVINIACAFDQTKDFTLIDSWKERNIKLTSYPDKNLLCISTNSNDVCLAFIEGTTISGFYTNIQNLVLIFNQAIMHPFIVGAKI
jgi:hypothetical protein